jgi:hypothetical protein
MSVSLSRAARLPLVALFAALAAILALIVVAPAAHADATGFTLISTAHTENGPNPCSTGTGTTLFSIGSVTSGDIAVVTIGAGYEDTTYQSLSITGTTVGATTTLVGRNGVAGAVTGHWGETDILQFNGSGTETVTLSCSSTTISRVDAVAVIVRSSTGTYGVDKANYTPFNYTSFPQAVGAQDTPLTNSNDLVVDEGFIRESSSGGQPITLSVPTGQATDNFAYNRRVNAGTDWLDNNATSGSSTYASSTYPSRFFDPKDYLGNEIAAVGFAAVVALHD